jgi:isoquinoline 1-oxidoreductase subunit beta
MKKSTQRKIPKEEVFEKSGSGSGDNRLRELLKGRLGADDPRAEKIVLGWTQRFVSYHSSEGQETKFSFSHTTGTGYNPRNINCFRKRQRLRYYCRTGGSHAMGKSANQSRRSFLKISAAAGGGLLVGFHFPEFASGQAKAPSNNASEAPFAPNIWLRVGVDDRVTIILSLLELGQGAMTSMPMLVAEELDADWNKVEMEWAPADPAFGKFHKRGRQTTGGSESVRGHWKTLREAGALARVMLVAAAALTWEVTEESCSTEKGEVIHNSSGRRLRYGALAEKASTLPVPQQIALKDRSKFRLIGQAMPRLDIPEKVNGGAIFGMDIRRPGMLVARVLRCPVFGGKVTTFNADPVKAVPGVHQVVKIGSGIAVVADSYWAATKGLRALQVTWDEGPNANLSSEEIWKRFADAAEKPGWAARNDGDFAKAMQSTVKRIEAVYQMPYLAHATMEPMNCTADVRKDGCDVWVPTQSQTAAHEAAIEITGLPPSAVKIHTTYVGGGFGRRIENDYVFDAVETSKAVGRPVQVIWSREDDMQHDFYRPATYARFWAALDESGMPIAWMQRIVQPAMRARTNPEAMAADGGVDANTLNGAVQLPYRIPNVRVEYIRNEPGVPLGAWRSTGWSVNGYLTESFFDEVAAAGGKDPFELRRHLLDRSPRHKAVLELAAEKAGWGKPLAPGRFRGVSLHEMSDGYVAQVAEVSVGRAGPIRVHRVVCAIDCGEVVLPDGVKAVMEGGIAFGLTAALQGEITVKNGRAEQSDFSNYPILRMSEMPETEIHIVPSSAAPGGAGEAAVPPIASAVVNAIFAATGKRIRRLPIRAEELKTV